MKGKLRFSLLAKTATAMYFGPNGQKGLNLASRGNEQKIQAAAGVVG